MRGLSSGFDFAAHIEAVARHLYGEPNPQLSHGAELRFGSRGSLRVTTAGAHRGTWHDFESEVGGGVLDLIRHALGLSNGAAIDWLKSELRVDMPEANVARLGRLVATYDYTDEHGVLLYQACRYDPKDFRQRKPKKGGWEWSVKGVRQVPYRLPELLSQPERAVFIVEGERDVETLRAHNLLATTNAGGAGKWRAEFAAYFHGRSVIILPDNDDPGRAHAADIVRNLLPVAEDVCIVALPDLPPKGDVSDWFAAGGTRDALLALVEAAEPVREMPVAGADAEDCRPVIQVTAGELHEIASHAELVLKESGLPLYTRSGFIVRPVVDDVEAARGRRTKVARLAKVPTAGMIDLLSRVARWERWDSRNDTWVAVDPPAKIAEIILVRDGEWMLPPIIGVITTPTLRPDGSLLISEGYDAQTRLLLLSPPVMPPVILRPTRDDAVAALDLLKGLLTEFCFVNEASRSVALSGLITPVIRGAISVAPLHAARAPTPGSGKSYLADIAAAIAMGQRAPAMGAGKTEEELEKRLAAVLLSGASLVSIDNVNGELGGDALCQMVERPVVRIRPLGRSETIQIEARTTVFANGNNMVIVGDMVRRVIQASLDAEEERPELRQFKNDPVGTVLSDRGRYVAACLTIVRAYQAAGFPNKLPTLASYEDWSLLVRSALVWLGCDDPVETMQAARDEDPILREINDVFSQWESIIGLDKIVSVTTLIKEAEDMDYRQEEVNGHQKVIPNGPLHPEFRDALLAIAGDRRGISSRRLGRWLVRNKGRLVSGRRIEGRFDTHRKTFDWVLVAIGEGS